MSEKYLVFFTPETLFNSIAWQVEYGYTPMQEDLEQLVRYYRRGEISVKRGRGRPSKLDERIRWAKMVVRERHKGTSMAVRLSTKAGNDVSGRFFRCIY